MPHNALDEYLNQQINNAIIPGAVLLIAHQGQVVYEQAYGYAQAYYLDQDILHSSLPYPQKIAANIKPLATPLPMTVDHVFDLASITKALVTAFAAMILLDQGQLALDASVSHYLPAFATPDKRDITLAQLLHHCAGFIPWLPLYYHAENPQDAIAYIAQTPLAYSPGTQCLYSDLSFMTLGYLIEQVTAESLATWIKKKLFQPLNLDVPTFKPKAQQYHFAATSHGNPHEYQLVASNQFGSSTPEKVEQFDRWRTYTLVGEVNDGNAFHAFQGIAGHAGLFARAKDVQVLLNLLNQREQSREIIRAETLNTVVHGGQFDFSLGWKIMNNDYQSVLTPLGLSQHRLIGHNGFTGTLALCMPDEQFSLVLLTNRQNFGLNAEGKYNDLMTLRREVTRLALLFVREFQSR